MYTQDYISQLKSLHDDSTRKQGFGGKVKKLGKFHDFMKQWNPKTLLDYGCGKGVILQYLQSQYPTTECHGYDPAVSKYSKEIETTYECVFSNDVLEHIEPEFLDQVLLHIDQVSSKYIWLRIDTFPARKTLPDGRNAHLILESKDWWESKLKNQFSDLVYINLDKKGKLDVAIEKKVNTKRSPNI